MNHLSVFCSRLKPNKKQSTERAVNFIYQFSYREKNPKDAFFLKQKHLFLHRSMMSESRGKVGLKK